MGADGPRHHTKGVLGAQTYTAPPPKRPRLYGGVWRVFHWPMYLVGLIWPAHMAELATWWMHRCGYAIGGRVVAVSRTKYALLPPSRPRPTTAAERAEEVRRG